MARSAWEGTYRFAGFTLDGERGQLSCDGRNIPLRPKAYDFLLLLLHGGGRLFSKDELLDTLWPRTIVSEDSLFQLIRSVRSALGDAGAQAVVNVPRRGYRFGLPIEAEMPEPVSPAPPVRYAKSGDIHIACQVIGTGPVDLVYVPGWVSHLEYGWESPLVADFLRGLAGFSRLILFDKRGTGLSDRAFGLPTLEQRMDDVRAVLDEIGSRKAVFLGMSEGGSLAISFAAQYPGRVSALVLYGAFARRAWSPAYPWAPTAQQRQQFYDEIESDWGGPITIDDIAPSLSRDAAFRDWWATYQRRSASPADAMAMARMNTEVDVLDRLPAIKAPTLILHRTGDEHVDIEEARLLAGAIPGAELQLLPGTDHLIYAGDSDAIVTITKDFVQRRTA